jgi:hypothetical protein
MREKCEKLIKYDRRVLEISGLETDFAAVKFALRDFKIEVKKIRDASEFSDDNVQCSEVAKSHSTYQN